MNEFSTAEETLLKKLNLKCTNHDVGSCMMLKLVTYFNRLLKKSSIEIGDVAITQTSTETVVQDSSRNMEDFENMSEEGQVFDVISNQVWNFLRTRSLKWKVSSVLGEQKTIRVTPNWTSQHPKILLLNLDLCTRLKGIHILLFLKFFIAI